MLSNKTSDYILYIHVTSYYKARAVTSRVAHNSERRQRNQFTRDPPAVDVREWNKSNMADGEDDRNEEETI